MLIKEVCHGRIPEGNKDRGRPRGTGENGGVGGKHIALFNVEGTYYAIDDTFTHKGGPLSEGEVKRGKVNLPLARLNLRCHDR